MPFLNHQIFTVMALIIRSPVPHQMFMWEPGYMHNLVIVIPSFWFLVLITARTTTVFIYRRCKFGNVSYLHNPC